MEIEISIIQVFEWQVCQSETVKYILVSIKFFSKWLELADCLGIYSTHYDTKEFFFESGVGDLYGVNFADTKEVGTIIPNLIVKYMSLFIV